MTFSSHISMPCTHPGARSVSLRSFRAGLVVAALALTTAGCRDDASATTDASTSTTTMATTTMSTTTMPTTTMPTTSPPATTSTPSPSTSAIDAGFTAADQVQWMLELLADPAAATDELDMRFAPSLLSVVPPDTLTATLIELTGAYEVVEVVGSDTERTGVVERDTDGLRLSFVLTIDPTDGGRMVGLRFQPAPPQIVGEISPEVVDLAFADTAPDTGYAIFEVTDGRCDPLHRAGTDQPLAIASQFKLWVLIAVAEFIEAGSSDWDDLIATSTVPPSAPEGPLTGLADDEEWTVSDLAVLMISISDNTATDLLIDHVGRERVEAVMLESTGDGSTRNLPLLTTREALLVKLDPAHDAYATLPTAEQRVYLDTVLSDPSLELPALGRPDIVDSLPAGPWQIDRVEWFATPLDMCRAMVRLAELAEDPRHGDHISSALSANPGGDVDTERWSTVWFKGGSEPGVFASTWYLVDPDGSSFVASGALNDSERDFGDVAGVSATQLMIPLLETLPR